MLTVLMVCEIFLCFSVTGTSRLSVLSIQCACNHPWFLSLSTLDILVIFCPAHDWVSTDLESSGMSEKSAFSFVIERCARNVMWIVVRLLKWIQMNKSKRKRTNTTSCTYKTFKSQIKWQWNGLGVGEEEPTKYYVDMYSSHLKRLGIASCEKVGVWYGILEFNVPLDTV